MVDEKDRFGEKIHQSEKAREDQWARQQDAELLEKIRKKSGGIAVKCPQCGKELVLKADGAVHMLVCPQHHGAWIEASELEQFLKK